MNDPDRTAMWPVDIGDDLPERLWPDGVFSAEQDEQSGDPTDRLVSLGYIMGALRRRWRTWCAVALIGLVLGAGLYYEEPPLYQATTTILLNDGPNTDPATAIATDAALAQSTAVGEAVIKQLGLTSSVNTFLGSYVVATPSNQVVKLTASAPTSEEAVQRASAIAAQFLALRVKYANLEQQQEEATLNQQLELARQSYNLVTKQVNEVSAEPTSVAQQQKLAGLQAQQQQAGNGLEQTEVNIVGTTDTTRTATQAENKDSRVINDAVPLKNSKVKALLLYVGGGLFGGLLVGLAFVGIGALMSSRLRRRDDVAYALAAPVRLSVGPLRVGRLPSLPSSAAKRKRDKRRVVDHLSNAVPGPASGTAALAVVAVDDTPTVAQLVISLAVKGVEQGNRVLLADLSEGRQAARLLGLGQHGLTEASSSGVQFMVEVPGPDDIAPVGPYRDGTVSGKDGDAVDEALAQAATSADLVLTLATLDPATGGEHLRTWAASAVAVVTAGGATSEEIRAIGDMVRAGGLRLESAVLVGADASDASLGIADR